MIRKLHRKYVLIAMGSLAVVLVLLTAGINLFNYRTNVSKLNSTLAWLAVNEGQLPAGSQKPPEFSGSGTAGHQGAGGRGQMDPESAFTTRYFTVTENADGTLTANLDKIAAVDESTAEKYAQEALEDWLQHNKGSGFIDIYRYQLASVNGTILVIFLDAGREIESMQSLLLISSLVALGCLVAVFIPVAWLSKKATAPVAESLEKQKRFITDAGHELKTPLTILSANAEVLAMSTGDNEWLQSIRNQVERLRRLVNDLVQLSRLDEGAAPEKARFSLSDAVLDTAAPFCTPAEARGKQVTLDIAPDVEYFGSEPDIRRLVSLLCDNAVKYGDPGGSISVSLRAGRHPILTVRNPFSGVGELALPRLFDRFYRGDPARTQTGSFGLGLSVAHSIAEAHGGSISAAADGGDIVFTVQL